MKKYLSKLYNFLFLGSLFFGVLLAACEDDDKGNTGIVPTITEMTPTEGLKAGDILTIKGTDLDQVKLVRFGASYLYDGQYFDPSSNATQLILTVPGEAPSGEVFLVVKDETIPNILAGTIKVKEPAMTTVDPLVVEAGTVITITGADLDLAVSVSVGVVVLENVSVNEAGTVLTATCPGNIAGGILKITMANGTEVSFVTPVSLAEPVVLPVIATVSDAYLGSVLTITGTDLDLVTSVVFKTDKEVTEFVSQTAYKLEVAVPAAAEVGIVTLTLKTAEGGVESPEFTIGSVDPALYVFFNFDDKGIGWSGIGGVVTDADLAVDGTDFYEVNETVDGNWVTYFADNTSGRLNLDGVSAEGYGVRFDVNVLEVGAGVYLKFRLGDFWYAWSVGDDYASAGTNGWTSIVIPLTAFKDQDGNGNPITTADLSSVYEWGLNSGWGAGKIHMRIDNIGFALLEN